MKYRLKIVPDARNRSRPLSKLPKLRIITPETHPDHHVVGKEFGGHDLQDADWPGKRWFCESHDPQGYWMYATDGSGHWTNVSERAIGRTFHEIYYLEPGGKPTCSWFKGPVPSYTRPK